MNAWASINNLGFYICSTDQFAKYDFLGYELQLRTYVGS
jgi:hypothetical protein